jgi:hypothetical protein
MNTKLTICCLAVIVAATTMMITASTVMQVNALSYGQLFDKLMGGGQQKKCNNVKIMAFVSGINSATTGTVKLTGSATLQGQTVSKTISVSNISTGESVGLPLFFKKEFDPCPAKGTAFSIAVEGHSASGKLESISKPNIVDVDLSTQSVAAITAPTNTTK